MLLELVQSTVICDALVRLHQRILYAWLLLFPSQGLLLESASKCDRFLLLFLALIRLMNFHDL